VSNFTPVASLLGGVLIGLAAAMLWLANGRITGISGIVGNLPSARTGDVTWRIVFLAGLIVAPLGYAALAGTPMIRLDASPPIVIAGGLLVGFGTRLGSGCTSGHGVCGMARFSPRSIVATCLFMAAGFVTVFVMRHIVGG
jgi:uncharacterized protein